MKEGIQKAHTLTEEEAQDCALAILLGMSVKELRDSRDEMSRKEENSQGHKNNGGTTNE